jgi:hypothetical protein
MISSEDIEAWREDEKQTQFLEEQRRKADNHLGWGVQVLGKQGWAPCDPHVFKERKYAMDALLDYKFVWPEYEYRIYEIVKEKK